MTDALDRAAQAAYESTDPPPGTPWEDAEKFEQSMYRAQAAAALGVLIADLRDALPPDDKWGGRPEAYSDGWNDARDEVLDVLNRYDGGAS